jgi:hypothetical protein
MNAFQSSIHMNQKVPKCKSNFWSCKFDKSRNKTNSNTSLRFMCFPVIFDYLTQETTTGATEFSKQYPESSSENSGGV